MPAPRIWPRKQYRLHGDSSYDIDHSSGCACPLTSRNDWFRNYSSIKIVRKVSFVGGGSISRPNYSTPNSGKRHSFDPPVRGPLGTSSSFEKKQISCTNIQQNWVRHSKRVHIAKLEYGTSCKSGGRYIMHYGSTEKKNVFVRGWENFITALASSYIWPCLGPA